MASQTTPLLAINTSSLRSSSASTSSSLARNRKRNVTRYIAFTSAILSCLCAGSITTYSLYGHLFQSRLHYTQLQVNYVIIAAELALYLPVSILGYLCDRVGPAPLSFMSSILFSVGYLLAAFTYRSGAKDIAGYTIERGWPLWVMVAAFVIVGLGTTCMYLSAVTTCAKNFGKGRYRGIALASPIAAFGLSGMWQAQVGSRILYERRANVRGDVDVFKYFVFLAFTLLVVGLLGTVFLKVVDEDELIDEAVEELERSGLLEDSEFFRRRTYGTLNELSDDESEAVRRLQDVKDRGEEEARKKTWLLNEETSRFLKDRTMWFLAAGFFFVSGPGEAFLTNLGTIIGTLYPPSQVPTTSPATHVSIVAITSTIARIFFGTLTDVFAPAQPATINQSLSNSFASLPPAARYPPRKTFTISRISFLLLTALLLSLGQVLLASGLIQNHSERFWIVSTLIGTGYGAIFSLTPLIISVIWGVENFGTNWGIVAMVPAFGAGFWGIVYSAVYQAAAKQPSYKQGMEGIPGGELGEELLCYGSKCYATSFWAMAVSVWVGCALWVWAWKGRGGWSKRGIAV